MAPVIRELRARSGIDTFVCVTAQHRQMLDQVLDLFDIRVDVDFDLMRESQTLNGLTARIFDVANGLLKQEKPDLVLVHGDTTTAMAMSLACFHLGIASGHVEAGLRTYDFERPFPEEMNRRVIDLVAARLYAPTRRAYDNLVSEKVDRSRIIVTGNTVVDALRVIIARLDSDHALRGRFETRYERGRGAKPLVLITGHRRESFGAGFERICQAIRSLASAHDFEFFYPVHLNPNVKEPVNRILGSLPNVHLVEPVDYLSFVYLLSQAAFIITDSGGVQEEAVSIGKHVMVMREVTERPEGVEAGIAHLVGTNVDKIITTFERAVAKRADLGEPKNRNIYGDGFAARRIVESIVSMRESANTTAPILESIR